MQTYTITPICAGVFQGAEKSNFAYQKDPGVKLKAPILMYLVQGNGLCMLVDTGGSGEEWAAKHHHRIVQTEDMIPVNALRKLGVEPEDVQIIVNTHLHWDHCWSNGCFPNAKIYVQKREIQFALCPIPTQYTYYESPQIGLRPSWLDGVERMEIIDGDYALCDGIDLLLSPGHTPGFQCVYVNTTDGRYLITSDSTGITEAWEDKQTWGLPTPSGIHVNLLEYYETIRRLYPLADQAHILAGHDASVLEHSVYPYK
ncbi:MAG: N-acyl homoserine lactonase family protein [Oscillospiraceae bacterium]|nr:N-acyl homoserine lactonase family protein [Oscillospiraceae bacterium]